jgi:hypothetical protein
MFAKFTVSVAVVLLLSSPALRAQSNQPAAKPQVDDETSASHLIPFGPALAGTWKASIERLPLTGEFNEKVWGKNAVSVREIALTIKDSGDATLTISRKVLDARGRVVPGSPSIEEADVKIGSARPGFATRLDHDVTVVKAARRYPDNASDRWPLENLRVGVVTFTDSRDQLEVRFDPSDGQGAFSETLTRQRATRAAKG